MRKLSEEDIKLLKHKCETDLKFLCVEILGMKDWQEGLHDEIAQFLCTTDKEKLILVPRGHLKSSIVTVGYATQRILKNHNLRVLITNAVWDKAREFLQQISEYLIDSDLKDIYGSFLHKSAPWTKNEITIAQKTDMTRRGPTIKTAGLESVLTGSHCDLIINDDLVELNNVQTKEQVLKVIHFHDSLFAILDPGGELIDVGTRWGEDDLYGEIIKNRAKSLNDHIFTDDKDRQQWRKYVTL